MMRWNKEYWRQCSDPIAMKSDEFDILFDRNGDVRVGQGEDMDWIIPARIFQTLAAILDTDNKVSGWMDRIYRQLNPDFAPDALPSQQAKKAA